MSRMGHGGRQETEQGRDALCLLFNCFNKYPERHPCLRDYFLTICLSLTTGLIVVETALRW